VEAVGVEKSGVAVNGNTDCVLGKFPRKCCQGIYAKALAKTYISRNKTNGLALLLPVVFSL